MKAAAQAVLFLLLTTSCVPTPESYTIPPQHQPPAAYVSKDNNARESMKADDPDSKLYIVKDVRPTEGGPWRWTQEQPEFRFVLRSTENRALQVQFGINDRTFQQTGPVTILFSVNDHLLDRVRYISFGDKVFEKPVPQEWLKPAAENRVLMHILNTWPTNDPAIRLGVVLQSVGFVQR